MTPRRLRDMLTEPDDDGDEWPRWIDEASDDVITGTVVATGEMSTRHGTRPYVDVTLDEPAVVNGEPFGARGDRVRIPAWRTVLRNKIEEQQPTVGDQLGVRALGQRQSVDGSGTYFDYVVRVIHSEGRAHTLTEDEPF